MGTNPTPIAGPPSLLRDLERVRAPQHGGLYASAGEIFRDAKYGRDSLEAAEDLLDLRPDLAREVIRVIVALQGLHDVPAGPGCSEEERGKIHHEFRSLVMDGRRVGPEAVAILEALAAQRGGSPGEHHYFGTADATPLFVRLVGKYVDRYGPSILTDYAIDGIPVLDHASHPTTVASAVHAAVDLIQRTIDASPLGLVDFCRRNPEGIEYQGWTDGKTSLLDADSCLLDPTRPIATPEIQGLAFDALQTASRLFASSHPAAAQTWAHTADRLRERTLRLFWMPDKQYPSMAVTTDARGQIRQVTTIAALGAELLNTTLFDGLSAAERRTYVEGIVRRIVSNEFMTDGGVRTISHLHHDILPYWQYQGPYTTWPKQTFDISCGLRRQGFPALAHRLEDAVLNVINVEGDARELFYVNDAGAVLHDVSNHRGLPLPFVIAATNTGDATQTWTVTAGLHIKRMRGCLDGPDVPQSQVERALLRGMRPITLLRTRAACRAALALSPAARVDVSLGRQREREALARSNLPIRIFVPPLGLGA